MEIRTVLEIESREAVAEAVAAGIGVGVALEEDAHPDDRVHPIRVRDAELYLELHLTCLEERKDSPLIKAFFDVVTSIHDRDRLARLALLRTRSWTPWSPLLVIGSAVLHPLREVYIKDNAYPEGLAYAVMAMFAVLAGIHVAAAGSDPWAALEVWPLVVASGISVIVYYLFTVMCVKLGDVSVYYPIMRSSPLFVVVVGYLVLGQRYPFVLLTGIAIVLVSAFLLQYERGGARVLDNWRALVLAVAAMCAHGGHHSRRRRGDAVSAPPKNSLS